MDPKDPKDPEADVISIADARKKVEGAEVVFDKSGEPAGADKSITVNGAEFLKPVMAAIARELANVADPDGTVRVGGTDEASRAKTAAVVKGLGMGLGQALAEAFGKWAEKIETGQVQAPAGTVTVKTTPDDPDKKPS